MNPISKLVEIVKDPVELTSITLPSAALVVTIFIYKQDIHPTLERLPDPFTGDPYGAILFLVFTLVVSVILRRVSHDVLNFIYDKFYRNGKRQKEDTWYKRAKEAGILENDSLKNTYQEALDELKQEKHPIVAKVDLLQTQSKLARSITLILLIFSVILGSKSNVVLSIACFSLAVFMVYAFFKDRWLACEEVYREILEKSQAGASQ